MARAIESTGGDEHGRLGDAVLLAVIGLLEGDLNGDDPYWRCASVEMCIILGDVSPCLTVILGDDPYSPCLTVILGDDPYSPCLTVILGDVHRWPELLGVGGPLELPPQTPGGQSDPRQCLHPFAQESRTTHERGA
jgi:hypothetical protein